MRIVFFTTWITVDSMPMLQDHPSTIATAFPKFPSTIAAVVGLGVQDIFALGAARASQDS